MPKTLDIDTIYIKDPLAKDIAHKWESWDAARAGWKAERKELRDYIFATDTTKTSNKKLPWKNSTTRPKLTQLRDNLHANYMAALFPHDDFFQWQAGEEEATNKEKAKVITSYVKNKLAQSQFRQTVSKMVLDYIDNGNVFGEVNYVKKTHPDAVTGIESVIYQGPVIDRISTYDLVLDITAPTFKEAPKITRRLISVGELKLMVEENPDRPWAMEALQEMIGVRHTVNQHQGKPDSVKSHGLSIDGFSSIYNYMNSGTVEILEFEGTLYDIHEDKLYKNYRIVIADRCKVIYKEPFESWLGQSNKEHAGWRERPDNLMAMGPLDNLVGMQYRIDHLENLKADVFDMIAHPPVYQKGYVEQWEWGPGEKILGDVDSDVRMLSPDTTALNADFQIQFLYCIQF